VLIGGLLTSTLLTLVFVPAMYTIFDDMQAGVVRLFRRLSGSAPAASPSTVPIDTSETIRVARATDGHVGHDRPREGTAARPEPAAHASGPRQA
jgi:hypothetical protein